MTEPVDVLCPLLTSRQHQIITLIAEGRSNGQIATALGLTENTVKTHLGRVLRKLGASSRAGAVGAAFRAGLLS